MVSSLPSLNEEKRLPGFEFLGDSLEEVRNMTAHGVQHGALLALGKVHPGDHLRQAGDMNERLLARSADLQSASI